MSDITPPANDPTPETPTADQPATTTPQTDDAGQAQVQEAMDNATEKGYLGDKVDPLPNEAHSLESGPDAPPAVPDDQTRADIPTAPADQPPANA